MVIIDPEKQRSMEKRLGCIFCSNGAFAEMAMPLTHYREKTAAIPGVEYGFYQGSLAEIQAVVAAVDPDWVQYFQADTHIFCGFCQGQPVSFCIVDEVADSIMYTGTHKVGAIGCVGTLPQYRGRQIALRMVDLATLHLKNRGCHQATISYTHIDHWYQKLGYKTYARFSIPKQP